MGLFWPLGYSDDPCAGVNEAIEAFSRQAASERFTWEAAAHRGLDFYHALLEAR